MREIDHVIVCKTCNTSNEQVPKNYNFILMVLCRFDHVIKVPIINFIKFLNYIIFDTTVFCLVIRLIQQILKFVTLINIVFLLKCISINT